jgi:hypothetical protein
LARRSRCTAGTARFASANKGTLSVSGGALTFAASLETPTAATTYPFSGFVLYVDGPACVNATAYQGVEFTLSNVSVSTQCLILFKATDAAHVAKADDPDRGRCQASGACYAGAYFRQRRHDTHPIRGAADDRRQPGHRGGSWLPDRCSVPVPGDRCHRV